MTIRRALPLLILLCPGIAGAVTAKDMQAPVRVTRVDGRVVIDAQGRVASYTPRTPLHAALATSLNDLVRQLRFEPVELDGRVVEAEADMRVTLAATPQGDGALRLAIDNLVFPDATTVSEGPPLKGKFRTTRIPLQYPNEALRQGVGAEVLAVMRITPEGSVREVVVQQSALIDSSASPAAAASLLHAFEKASVAALRRWRVDLAAMPKEGTRVDGDWVVYVPVSYSVGGPPARNPGTWNVETRSVKRIPPWIPAPAKSPQPGAADLRDGETGQANTRYRLAVPLAALSP